jgi:hypothetical protein
MCMNPPPSYIIGKEHQDETENTAIKNQALFYESKIWKTNSQNNDITLTFGTYPCESCGTDKINWSVYGTDAVKSQSSIPSMNLSTLDPPFMPYFTYKGITYGIPNTQNQNRYGCGTTEESCGSNWEEGSTVLHEFGHALGMIHEHQNFINSDPFEFNTTTVYDNCYKWYGWDEATTYHNILKPYTCNNNSCPYEGSDFDPESIMMYSLPSSWIKSGIRYDKNYTLSVKDQDWLQTMYPLNATPKPRVNIVFLDGEEWKKKWVEKMVMDKIQPHVGIDFTFNKEAPPLPEGLTYPPLPVDNISDMSTEQIVGITMGVFILLVIIIVIFF